VQGQAELFQVVRALHATGGFSGGLDGRQQQRDENTDDRDDHQEFHERKSAFLMHVFTYLICVVSVVGADWVVVMQTRFRGGLHEGTASRQSSSIRIHPESTLRSISIGRMKGRVNVSSFFVPREERFAALGEGLLPR
jgi:hypothetical protein